jgi:hypothetical protein
MNERTDHPATTTLDADTLGRLSIQALERTAFVLADPCDDPESLAPAEIHARIDFRGPEVGSVDLGSSRAFARNLAASLLGTDAAEVSDAQSEEALRELANILGGSVITTLGGADCQYLLGLPKLGESEPDHAASTTRCTLDAEGERLDITCHRRAA